MHFINKLKNYKKLKLIIITSILFLNTVLTLNLHAASFKVSEIEVSEQFDLNFNKKKVFDKAFNKAFSYLTSMVVKSSDKKKLKKTKLSTIRSLIDSFNIMDEKFINNKYYASFDVNFNKKNTLNFFENENIFPSIPKKKDIVLIPIMVDLQSDEISLFNNNIFYEKWNNNYERYYLLNHILPDEDLEDVDLILQNSKSIEDYDFKKIIKKYDLNDFIIAIIYKNNNQITVLSKIKLNQSYKINSKKFETIDLLKEEDVDLILHSLKTIYEDYWKNINQINTSIKLPLTISIDAKQHEKIQIFENGLNELDLVSNFEILRVNNKNIYFKIIYNGSPKKFINEIKMKDIEIDTQNQIWKVQ